MAFYVSAEDLYQQMTVTMGDQLDTSENSFIYNQLFPACLQLSHNLMSLDEALNKVFASQALKYGYSEYLELRCAEKGIFRKPATYAEFPIRVEGKIDTVFKVNSIVSTLDNRLYYTQADAILQEDPDKLGVGVATVIVKAAEVGEKYNVKEGDVCYLPVKYAGITSVKNLSDYAEGLDEESDKDLYERYLLEIRTNKTSGNINHYKQWCLETNGVGAVRVYECKNDNYEKEDGSVLCVIGAENHRTCSEELLKKVYDHIEENRPIGAKVYVISSLEKEINISATVTLANGYNLDEVNKTAILVLNEYFENMDFDMHKISLTKITGLLLSIEGIEDCDDILLNGEAKNVILQENELAVLNDLILS